MFVEKARQWNMCYYIVQLLSAAEPKRNRELVDLFQWGWKKPVTSIFLTTWWKLLKSFDFLFLFPSSIPIFIAFCNVLSYFYYYFFFLLIFIYRALIIIIIVYIFIFIFIFYIFLSLFVTFVFFFLFFLFFYFFFFLVFFSFHSLFCNCIFL